jgi:hypothetical protein
MLDALLARLSAPVRNAIAPLFASRGNSLELVLFCLALTGAALIAHHWVFAGLVLFALARIFASAAAPSGVAAVCGAVAFAALPFAFALEAPVRALPALFLIFALSAVSAARLKLGAKLIGETELFLLFLATALFPDWFGPIAYVGGVLCFVATGVAAARRV